MRNKYQAGLKYLLSNTEFQELVRQFLHDFNGKGCVLTSYI